MNPKLKKKLRKKMKGAGIRAWFFAAMKKKDPTIDVRIIVMKIIHATRY